ncbi:MAG: PPC domain-containing protein [Gemmatimonadales bacterium]
MRESWRSVVAGQERVPSPATGVVSRWRAAAWTGPVAGLCLSLALVGGLVAQEEIKLNETRSGSLDVNDLRLDDGSFYDLWKFVGKAGQTIRIVMRSSDFDAYLVLGRMDGSSLAPIGSDDDGAGGTDSKLVLTLPVDGVYVLRANSVHAEETGNYSLSIETGDPAEAARGPDPLPEPVAIAVGQTVSGELSSSDARMADSSFYDLYSFEGRKGQYVIITMRSGAFDAYLSLGRIVDGDFSQIESDDDGGGGEDSRLEYELTEDGTYAIRANSVFSTRLGGYTLSLEVGTVPPKFDPKLMQTKIGQTVEGELTGEDARLASDKTFYQLYQFSGRAGQRVRIVLRSSDFDSYLAVGRGPLDGDHDFANEPRTDDDSGGDRDAQLTITLHSADPYFIRVNTVARGETGKYSLSLADAGMAPPPPAPRAIKAGQTVDGELTDHAALAEDDTYYDLYSLTARRGDRLVITLDSPDFDAYLALGRMEGGEFNQLESDDDSGGDTNARIEFTAPAAGTYFIRANTVSKGEVGKYRLRVSGGEQ